MNLKQIKTKLNSDPELVFKRLNIEYEVFNGNVYCRCPIHEGSDNPRALSFSLDKGIWRCWTRGCQEEHGNDIFGFITATLSKTHGEDITFKQTLAWVCEILGIKHVTRDDTPKQLDIVEDEFSDLVKFINKKPQDYQDIPIECACKAEIPSEYFVSRRFNKRTMKYFDIGDCNENGPMKDRAIIPIHNDTGESVVGIIGRATKHYRTPKFLFYPTGFNKRHYFYNYNRALKRAKETSCMFITEGQGDVWKLYESGVSNAVSVFGKTISDEQVNKLLQTPITKIVVLMDSDQAGREARLEIYRKLNRIYKLIFPKVSGKDIGDMTKKQVQENILSSLEGLY